MLRDGAEGGGSSSSPSSSSLFLDKVRAQEDAPASAGLSVVLVSQTDEDRPEIIMTKTLSSSPSMAGDKGCEEDDCDNFGGDMDGDNDHDDNGECVSSTMTSWSSYVCGNHCGSSRDSKLSCAGLAVMVFYSAGGGPFGVEPAIRSAGSFYTILGFLLFPFVWSLQNAMITAELGAAYPEASGGVAWVEEAFGSKWAFLRGYLGWIAAATDNGIYPVLMIDYLLEVLGVMMNPVVRFVLLAMFSMILSYINWMGLSLVGNMSIVICALAMSPFVVFTIVGAFFVEPSRWLEGPTTNITIANAMLEDNGSGLLPFQIMGGVVLRPFLNNLFWNLSNFGACASFAEEVDDPGRVLPKAMGYGLVMVVLGYLIPVLVALGASDSIQSDWVDGYLAKVCSDVVGSWFGAWIIFAAGISNIALFQAELSENAYKLMGMAERGHVPAVLATRSQHGTPTYGILVGCAIIIALGAANIERLVEMLNFNISITLLMEYAAFLKLRISQPALPRPFKIPLNTFGCSVALVPSIFFTAFLMALADVSTLGFSILTNATGLGLYYFTTQIRERQDHELPVVSLVNTSHVCSRGGDDGKGDSSSPSGTSSSSSRIRRTGGILRGKKYERVESTDVTNIHENDDMETHSTASSTESSTCISDRSIISRIMLSSNNSTNTSSSSQQDR